MSKRALLLTQIDIGIHSMKDMPTFLPENIALHAIMPREDVRDALISEKYASLNDLPRGATLGTASLRRTAVRRREAVPSVAPLGKSLREAYFSEMRASRTSSRGIMACRAMFSGKNVGMSFIEWMPISI